MKRTWQRLCNKAATFFLLVMLAAVSWLTSACDIGEPKAYYGPPPLDDTGNDVSDDAAVYYGPQPIDGFTTDSDVVDEPDMAVYYGPQPVDMIDDQDVVDIDQMQTLYGPQPVDLVETDAVVYYGPTPVDVKDTNPDQDIALMYGPPVVDVVEDCEPMAYYGPPPCSSDQECTDDYGAGWYCDTTNTMDPGCGEPFTYPICKQK